MHFAWSHTRSHAGWIRIRTTPVYCQKKLFGLTTVRCALGTSYVPILVYLDPFFLTDDNGCWKKYT